MSENTDGLILQAKNLQDRIDGLYGEIGDCNERIRAIALRVSEASSPLRAGDVLIETGPFDNPGRLYAVTGYLPPDRIGPGKWAVEIRRINRGSGLLAGESPRAIGTLERVRKVGSFNLASNRLLSLTEEFLAEEEERALASLSGRRVTCKACGAKNGAGEPFCHECSKPVPAVPRRAPATRAVPTLAGGAK